MNRRLVTVDRSSVSASCDLGNNNEFQSVHAYSADAPLHTVTPEQLNTFRAAGHLALKKINDGQYKLGARVRELNTAQGGFWAGKFIIHLVARLGYGIVAAVAGMVTTNPLVSAVIYGAMEATFAMPVEAASNIVGLGCVVAGGIAMGPV